MKTFLIVIFIMSIFGSRLQADVSYRMSVRNFDQSSNQLTFNVYLKCTSATPFELAQVQPVIHLNPEFVNSGKLSATIQSEIDITPQLTLTDMGNGTALFILINHFAPLSERIIIRQNEELPICTVTLNNTANFGYFAWTWRESPVIPFTKVFRYDGAVIECTNSNSHEPIKLVTSIHNETLIAEGFELFQNFPNPFNPSTTIEFTIPKSHDVKISIFNIEGKEVYSSKEYLLKGKHSFWWNGTDFPSGTYLYKLEAGNFSETKKMTLLK